MKKFYCGVQKAQPSISTSTNLVTNNKSYNVSRQTINTIETGKYDPSLPLAFKLADLFGKTIEELFFPEREQAYMINPKLKDSATDYTDFHGF